jgi:hypothetical protein
VRVDNVSRLRSPRDDQGDDQSDDQGDDTAMAVRRGRQCADGR